MKIGFNLREGLVKSSYGINSSKNVSVGLHPRNLEYLPDTFIKSAPVFCGNDNNDALRPEVIKNGVDGIKSCLMIYLFTCTGARGHKMPTHEDFDYCMDIFFPLCCAASSSYATENSDVLYPTEDEFVEILQNLWSDSDGMLGASEDYYDSPNFTRLDPLSRRSVMYRFIQDDMARAMNMYSKNKYGTPVKNHDDVRELAVKIYNDDSIQTISPLVSKVTLECRKKGRISSYQQKLMSNRTPAAILQNLLSNKDLYFSSPMSIRERYEDSIKVDNERYPNSSPYWANTPDDNRTDAEKAIDQMIGMPW